MIRILQIVPNMQAGGLENFIMNIYRKINKENVQFDFLVHYKEKKHFDDEIEKMGGKIYRFSLRDDNNIIKYIFQLNRFYKEHPEYKIIHCHMSSIGFINFLVAKKNGVKVRIAHSHNTNTEKNFKGLVKSIMIKPLKYMSTDNFACSTPAGKFLFGKKPFTIIPNAIDINLYKYDERLRREERKKMGVEDKLVIGHVGRFELQKNHKYIIDIFEEILKEKKNAVLLLAGNGSLFDEIKEYAKQKNVFENIKFLGVVKDTYKLYQAMDCFVLPSFFEGLPVVGIEAQVSGLKCYFSRNITQEVKISPLAEFLDINFDSIATWKEAILSSQMYDRKKIYSSIKGTKYNAETAAKILEKFYVSRFK